MNAKKGVIAGFSAGIAMVLSGIVVWGTTQGYLMPVYETSAALWKPMEPLSTWRTDVGNDSYGRYPVWSCLFCAL